ncbi:MAG: toll/interleukin-1 receptor domain-containing protein [Oscillibacter sp.]|nr:toll/interleukin-1 receptor domain-containing protein [Oscillibacter sp.]
MENMFHGQFQIYNGPEPYIFVSYCHQDAEIVLDILGGLVRAGCRIWFDGGIPWTDEWGQTIRDRIDHCAVFMAFHSAASAQSEHCRLEIRYALDSRKPAISAYLEDVTLGHGLDERLARHRSARLSEYGDRASLEGALMRQSIAAQCAAGDDRESGKDAGEGAVWS